MVAVPIVELVTFSVGTVRVVIVAVVAVSVVIVAFGETRAETYPFPEMVAVAIVAVVAMRLVTVEVTVVEATRVVVTKLLATKVPVTVCVTTVMPGKFPFPKASSVDAVHTITPPIAAS